MISTPPPKAGARCQHGCARRQAAYNVPRLPDKDLLQDQTDNHAADGQEVELPAGGGDTGSLKLSLVYTTLALRTHEGHRQPGGSAGETDQAKSNTLGSDVGREDLADEGEDWTSPS
jgi:hypothetical protein